MIIVSLIGLKKCGKTTTAENLIAEFRRRGLTVGSVKFMPNSTMTLDVEGKDTWRHREAGADFVISLSRSEIAFIRNKKGRSDIDDALELVPEGTDVLLCEGYNSSDPRIKKVLCAKDPSLLKETMKVRGVEDGFIAISGIISGTDHQHPGCRVLNSKDPEELSLLADLILNESSSA